MLRKLIYLSLVPLLAALFLLSVTPKADAKSAKPSILSADAIAYKLTPKKSIKFNQKPEPSSVDLQSVVFDFNSAKLTEIARLQLNELGKALTMPAFKTAKFIVGGHTDAVGGENYNQSLSQMRANAVVEYLSGNFGVSRAKLVPVGWGEKRPLKGVPSEDGANRRVEITNLTTVK